MTDIASVHERRRRAPFHFYAKADNARFTAFTLWSLDAVSQKQSVATSGYGGTPSIALGEAFRREASIALELIVKAVIAARIERKAAKSEIIGVRPTHDLNRLWEDADLPAMQNEDVHRLLIAKRILYWSGRYAAPLKDEDFEKEEQKMRGPYRTRGAGQLEEHHSVSIGWDDFDRIYGIACASFWVVVGGVD